MLSATRQPARPPRREEALDTAPHSDALGTIRLGLRCDMAQLSTDSRVIGLQGTGDAGSKSNSSVDGR